MLIYSLMSVPGMLITNGTDYAALFDTITGNPLLTVAGLAAFVLINSFVISNGIQNGIEKYNKVLMPLLFIFLLLLSPVL